MTFRRSLTVALAATMLLTACAGDDVADTTDPGAEQPADDQTADDAAAGDTQPVTVALSFDGQQMPIVQACNGVDGAVLATTEGEVTIMLVREERTVLRYEGEGRTAETDEVSVDEVGASTIYRATLVPELPAVDVALELGDTSVLDDC